MPLFVVLLSDIYRQMRVVGICGRFTSKLLTAQPDATTSGLLPCRLGKADGNHEPSVPSCFSSWRLVLCNLGHVGCASTAPKKAGSKVVALRMNTSHSTTRQRPNKSL